MNGHSGFAEFGQDIICAGISTLTIAIFNGITEVCKIKKVKINENDGFLSMHIPDNISKDDRKKVNILLDTLILAYVGSSLTLILLFMACEMNIYEILNKETIAEEIIPAIAGSIGVVFTVPITSLIYSVLNKDKVIYEKTSKNKLDGKRSLKI